MDAETVALLGAQHGVATTWQLLEHLGDERLRTLRRRGELVRVRHGVYADGTLLRRLDPPAAAALAARAEQLLRRRPEVVSGLSAALVHGLPVLGRPPAVPRLSLPREQGERPREDRPRAWLLDDDLQDVDGLPVTSLARTVVDVARTRPFAFALATADAGLRAGLDPRQALEVLDRCRKWPGARSARRVLDAADGRSESPLESLGRGRFLEQGLPVPDLQVDLGERLHVVRVDQYWKAHRRSPRRTGSASTTAQVLRAEKLREDYLRDRGEEVVRYVWDEALRTPGLLAERVRRAFDRAARAA